MNRTGGAIALGIAVAAGLLFGLFPQLDIAGARLFSPDGGFPLQHAPSLMLFRDGSMWLIQLMIAPVIIAVLIKLIFPRSRMLVRGRTALLLISTLILGPWLVTNVVLKDHWGRPRPREVVELGGAKPFVPWWSLAGTCEKNCSFASGEASAAAWTFAPASVAPPPWRPLAYAGAAVFTAAVGVKRAAFGGHFLSDVVFGGVITFLIVWLVHGLIFRWRTRISDEAIEGAIARAGWLLRRPFGREEKPSTESKR